MAPSENVVVYQPASEICTVLVPAFLSELPVVVRTDGADKITLVLPASFGGEWWAPLHGGKLCLIAQTAPHPTSMPEGTALYVPPGKVGTLQVLPYPPNR